MQTPMQTFWWVLDVDQDLLRKALQDEGIKFDGTTNRMPNLRDPEKDLDRACEIAQTIKFGGDLSEKTEPKKRRPYKRRSK